MEGMRRRDARRRVRGSEGLRVRTGRNIEDAVLREDETVGAKRAGWAHTARLCAVERVVRAGGAGLARLPNRRATRHPLPPSACHGRVLIETDIVLDVDGAPTQPGAAEVAHAVAAAIAAGIARHAIVDTRRSTAPRRAAAIREGA